MKLVYRPSALADLDAIYDFIESDNPRRAASFVAEIRAKCGVLREHPLLGRARPDIRPGLRIYPMFGRIVVVCRVVYDAVVITRVFSGGQDYAAIVRDEDDVQTPRS